ncbi:hypothetical protein BASA60_009165 [Batrachochytrium salamandrivorans]|nr:hypothetical protein BASA60_009165 [Batrachochytrium salamandrivorans]KAH9266441.1 hypothetical protein BASA83_010559 [Batrachochytrium salamandrivorans]
MKLISVAAISFLAIAVSAYPHRSAASQGLEENQGATTQSTQQYQSSIVYILRQRYRGSLQEEMGNLETSYKVKQAAVDDLQSDINEMQREISDMESRANRFSRPGGETSSRVFFARNRPLAIAQASKSALEDEMRAIMEEYAAVVNEIASLDDIPE